MPKPIVETATLLQPDTALASGHGIIQLISPGWGSSGHYSAQVIENAVRDQVIPAGTHMYADHPTVSEARDRPVRSIKDLAAVTTSDARIATEADIALGATQGAAVAEVRVFAPWRKALAEMAEVIGTSIRGDAVDIVLGEADGRKGSIITGLAHVKSIDFVTRAGRGGKILALAEAASVEEARNIGQWVESRIHRDFTITADDMAAEGRLTRAERIQLSSAIGDALAAFVANLEANAPQLYARDLWDEPADTVAEARQLDMAERVARRAVGRGVDEATANDAREALQQLVADAYGGDRTWCWVRDFDEATVWFEVDHDGDSALYAQAYETDSTGPSGLTGDRTEVRVVTTYVPAARPDGSTTEESEEDTMPNIEESELARLREDAGRVSVLESERDQAIAERDHLREQTAQRDRADRARALIAESADGVTFTPLEEAGLLANLPVNDGALNEAAFTETVKRHVAEKKKAAGAGTVRGFGGSSTIEESKAVEAIDDIDSNLGIKKGA